MTSHPLTLHEPTLLQKSDDCPRGSEFETAAGSLILHSFCTPSLVTSLKADRGLHAFARVPEREHQLLLGIAERPDCALTLAYTATGEIVGQVTLAPLDHWWKDIGNAYEIAVEVSAGWRKQGIAHRLLSFELEFESGRVPDSRVRSLLALGLCGVRHNALLLSRDDCPTFCGSWF